MDKEEKKKIFGLNKNIFVLGIVSLFNDFSSEMILSIFPAFFAGVLKAGAASLGVVEGIADAGSNFIKIFSGKLSDKIQKRKIFVVLGYSLSTLTRPFYIWSSTVNHVLGLRLTDRIGKGLRDAPRDALISLSTTKDETGKSFGYQRAMDTIGGVLGPLAAFFILSLFPAGFNLVFMIAFFSGFLAIIALAAAKDIIIILKKGDGQAENTKLSRRFKSFLVSAFILSVGNLPLAVMLLKTKDIGLSLSTIPLFYSISNITFALSSIIVGRISDKFGHRKIIIIGYVFLILSYVLLSSSSSTFFLVITFLLYGLYLGLTDGILRSYAAKLTAETSRGRAYGFLNGITGLGVLFAGIGSGIIWEKFGSNTALLTGGILITIGLMAFAGTQLIWKHQFSRI